MSFHRTEEVRKHALINGHRGDYRISLILRVVSPGERKVAIPLWNEHFPDVGRSTNSSFRYRVARRNPRLKFGGFYNVSPF